jgi:hypothetical protein
MKVQVSHRLDSDLLAWATEYGEQRGKSRAVIIEEALKVFRDLCAGGVADLPMTRSRRSRRLRRRARRRCWPRRLAVVERFGRWWRHRWLGARRG